MATFVGQERCGLNYETVRPMDRFGTGQKLHHVREQYAERTLCGASCHPIMDDWECLEDVHPEDVDADQRCERCFEILANRNRRARGERAHTSRRRRKVPVTMARPKDSPAQKLKRARERRDKALADANLQLAALVREAQDAGAPMHELAKSMGCSRQNLYLFMERMSATD